MPAVGGLLLAAGGGRRYGMPKALARHGDALMVEHGLATLAAGGCAPIVVVLGAAAEQVVAQATLGDACVVVNQGWTTGMGSSLRMGLATLRTAPVAAALVLLVDTPGVTPAAVRRVAAQAGPLALAAASYHGQPGHPVLLGRAHWSDVAAQARADLGARRYLARHAERVIRVPCEDVADGTDVDRPPATRADADTP